jgi:hypothetical protein
LKEKLIEKERDREIKREFNYFLIFVVDQVRRHSSYFFEHKHLYKSVKKYKNIIITGIPKITIKNNSNKANCIDC